MPRRPTDPDARQRWRTFLANHREAIAPIDFFTAWITQQLREAFPYDQAPRYLILDRDAKYGNEVITAIRHMGIEPKQITARSPWQNGVAERFHLSLEKDAPAVRAVESKPHPAAEIIALPRLGGLHHRYAWRRAA
jgi:putative transposase